MRITHLELENIKSYRRSSITFTEGLNAVCGSNGSGKTTILEAIGYALFDYQPYTLKAFVREGEKSGTIRVRLLARDGREYEVVRRVGSGGLHYVSDVATGMRIADGAKDVPLWIHGQALDIEGQTDLRALFKNAVGVPQGLITADFQGTGAQRKTVFDPLLRVDEYQKAYESLRETVSHVRDLSGVVREKIAGLETETGRIPHAKEEEAILREALSGSNALLNQLAVERTLAEDQKAAFDEVEKQLGVLALDLQGKRAEVRDHSARLTEQEKAVEAARTARRVVEESEPGYQLVIAARRRLEQLGERQKARDAIRQELAAAQSERQGIYGRIQGLDQEILQAAEAAQQAATLVEPVSRQTELEGALQEARLRLRDAKQLDEQILRLGRSIRDLETALPQLETRLIRAREAERAAAGLADERERLREVGETLVTLGHLQKRADVVKIEGQGYRQQYDELLGQRQRRDDLLKGSAQREQVAADFDALVELQQQKRDERTRLVATIEYQDVARRDLKRLQCPLLELECPVARADVSVLDRFDHRVQELSSRVTALDGELAAVEERVRRARSAAQEQQSLLLQAAALEGSERQLVEVEESLLRCRNEYAELARALSSRQQLEQEQRDLQERVRRLEREADLASQLQVLQERHDHDLQELEAQRRHRAELEERRSALASVEQEVARIERELEALGDPRGQQQSLLGLAQRKPELESALEREHRQFREAADRVKALLGQLESFSTLDREIAEQKILIDAHLPEYERYMENREEAKQLVERERVRRATSEALEAARTAEGAVQRQLDETASRYDAERHTWLRVRCDELGRQVAAEEENHKHLTQGLRRIEEELAYLRWQEDKLRAQYDQLAELERIRTSVAFIRDTIKAAGPAITETLLGNISQAANDIYAEIMDDHVAELRWDRDYEVIVQRAAEERKFAQLSGGEQMSAALAVRLALLREMSDINFAFFDEPTQNMDSERRTNLAEQIRAVRGFEQLIVISHDDTFEHHTENLIRLSKVDEVTQLEVE